MEQIQTLWERVSNIGITPDVPYLEQVKIRVMNQVIGLVFPIQLIISAYFICTLEVASIIIGLVMLFFLIGLWLLNNSQRFTLARLLLNTMFPLIMLFGGIFSGENSGLQYNLLIFVVAVFVFHKSLILKIVLSIYNVILFFFLMYYWQHYESPFSHVVPPIFQNISYMVTIMSIVALIQRFLTEMSRAVEENQRLLKSLEKNNEELKNANGALERFAYVASHDLKTPLRTILGFTELLERDYKNNKIERFPVYFTQVKRGARQMNELIKNTLEYSRINHLTEEKKAIDLNKIIENIATAYLTDQNVQINYQQLPTIVAEENQVLSLFQNLIENGIKYNDKSTKTINISYSQTPYSNQLIVQDNGIGIPKKFHQQIFTMFKRLHTNQQYEGTGLGLAICEKIVDKMNGQISLTSIEGKGTTFYIDLPKD